MVLYEYELLPSKVDEAIFSPALVSRVLIAAKKIWYSLKNNLKLCSFALIFNGNCWFKFNFITVTLIEYFN